MNLVLIGNLKAAHGLTGSCLETPAISNKIRPGFTTATQNSETLTGTHRVSAGRMSQVYRGKSESRFCHLDG